MWRAITSPLLQSILFASTIVWQAITAIICWLGTIKLLSQRHHDVFHWEQAKQICILGLFSGFLLYFFAFLIIGGEWFVMWQSHQWNAQMKAGLFASMIMFIWLYIDLARD